MSKGASVTVLVAALAALVPTRARASALSKLFSAAPAPLAITKEFPAAGLKSIKVSVQIGNISVAGVSGSSVTARISNDEPAFCELTAKVEGSVLKLSARGTNKWFWQADRCRADFTVSAPAGLRLKAEAGLGDVSASGLSAGADINVGSGNVRLTGVAGGVAARDGNGLVSGSVGAGNVSADVGNGSVALSGLEGSADIKEGDGNVRLAWAKAPELGRADVKSGAGDVALAFPPGAQIQASVTSGLGAVDDAVANTAGAPFVVKVISGVGHVSIK